MRHKACARLGGQFVLFAGAGAVATAVHYLLYVSLVETRLLDALRASAAGFVAGALVSYGLSAALVFRDVRRGGGAVWRFVTVAGIGLALNSAVVLAATRTFGLHYLAAQGTATALVLVWSFTGNRWWTFASDV
jgi:putative flippase GtrA